LAAFLTGFFVGRTGVFLEAFWAPSQNSTIVQGGGFGCDFITARTRTGWGNALFYISGSINLGGLFQTGSPKPKNKGLLL